MKIFRDLGNIPAEYKNSVVALGNFDGFHLGHRGIVRTAAEIAKKHSLKTAVMTFEPHPREFFASTSLPSPSRRGQGEGVYSGLRILNLSSKLAAMKELGVECVFLTRFNHELAGLNAEDFVKNILVDKLAARHIITGKNFHFGKNRTGDSRLLSTTAATYGFEYLACAPIEDTQGTIFSSSAIRSFLKEGEVKKAAAFLGHNYYIAGRVKHGEGRGNKIGFPTANLTLDKLFAPKYGVYAVNARVEGENKTFPAIANLGVKPTFGINTPMLEVHLFNIEKNLYGKKICVEFIDFIRSEQKFNSIEELTSQIAKDCKTAKEILSN